MSTTDKDDGWTTVAKQPKKGYRKDRRSNRSKQQIERQRALQMAHVSTLPHQELQDIFALCQTELASSNFWKTIQDHLSKSSPPDDLVCYGLGNFETRQSVSPSAPQWQLACVLQWMQVYPNLTVYYYEPLMTSTEATFLEQKGIQVIRDNEQAKRQVTAATMFFMPHCPLRLYSNLLVTNWNQLHLLSIFGNSLTEYANQLKKNPRTRLLEFLQPLWDEKELVLASEDVAQCSGHFDRAFNDSSIITFPNPPELELPKDIQKDMEDSSEDAEVL